jgi:hypothetical protein
LEHAFFSVACFPQLFSSPMRALCLSQALPAAHLHAGHAHLAPHGQPLQSCAFQQGVPSEHPAVPDRERPNPSANPMTNRLLMSTESFPFIRIPSLLIMKPYVFLLFVLIKTQTIRQL